MKHSAQRHEDTVTGHTPGKGWYMDTNAPRAPAPGTSIDIDNRIIDDYGEQLGAYGIAIYTAIKRHLNEDATYCTASYATIARKLRTDRGTVMRYVQTLTAFHLLSPSLRFKPERSQSSTHATVASHPRSRGDKLVSYGESLRDERG